VSERSHARRLGPDWLRRALGSPRVVPLTALVLRSLTVKPSIAFAVRELLGSRRRSVYRLRSDDEMLVVVRHRTADLVTLGEVFHERDYAPPDGMPGFVPRRIIDLGANVGYFGAFALSTWPSASVIAFEPDPANVLAHEQAIAVNQLAARWELRRVAAGTRDGETAFHASGDALSHAAKDGPVVVLTEDVLPLIADADLLKMDVEGGEWDILADPRFRGAPPRVVVLEYHPRSAPAPDTHAAVVERLDAAGLTARAWIFRRESGYGMLWAWQP